jgi:hypothetical protein
VLDEIYLLYGLSFSVKLHLYLTGKTLIHYGSFFLSVHKCEVELFISHSLVTKTGMSDNQKRGGCTSS